MIALDDRNQAVNEGIYHTLNGEAGMRSDAILAATLSGGGHPGSNMPGRHKEDDENLVIARSQTSRNERIDAESENFIVASADRASDGHHGHSNPRGDGADNLIAFHQIQDPINTAECRTALGGKSSGMGISSAAGVRRLTPLECERLMAFPDDWTRYAADGTEISDSHRYRMCGNGVVSTVAEYIGHRLVATDRFMAAERVA